MTFINLIFVNEYFFLIFFCIINVFQYLFYMIVTNRSQKKCNTSKRKNIMSLIAITLILKKWIEFLYRFHCFSVFVPPSPPNNFSDPCESTPYVYSSFFYSQFIHLYHQIGIFSYEFTIFLCSKMTTWALLFTFLAVQGER